MLTDAIRLWRTPDAPHAGGVRNRQASQGQGHQLTIAEQAEHWPTPSVPNGGRTPANEVEQVDQKGTVNGVKRQVDLGSAARTWATPSARDWKDTPGMTIETVDHDGTPRTRDDQLARQVFQWPTPTATPYGSSQNGINGIGGEHERPSANTPSLERLSRSFLPLLQTLTDGDESSPSRPTSPQQWKTPHGFANTDQYGRTGGGGGEFHKQAMSMSTELQWPTPCAETNRKSPRALEASRENGRRSGGGQSSPLGLEQMAELASGELPPELAHGQELPPATRNAVNTFQPTAVSTGKPKLNPRFVTWLMGFPIGWTEFSPTASTSFVLWETASSHSLRQLRSASSPSVSGLDSSLTEPDFAEIF